MGQSVEQELGMAERVGSFSAAQPPLWKESNEFPPQGPLNCLLILVEGQRVNVSKSIKYPVAWKHMH